MKKTSIAASLLFGLISVLYAQNYVKEAEDLLYKYGINKYEMSAQDYNAAGMYFYERNLFYEAELMFYRAIEIDDGHVLAHYNMACVLSIGFNGFYYGSKHHPIVQFTQTKPFYYLYRAVVLDPGRMGRAREDADFNNIRAARGVFFDYITLPESREQRIRYTGAYRGVIQTKRLDRENVYFIELKDPVNGLTHWIEIDDPVNNLLAGLGLYTQPAEALPGGKYRANEEKKGKIYLVQSGYQLEVSRKIREIGLFEKIRTIEELG